MVLPVLCLIFFGIIQFGITLNHYIELANGVAAGAHQLSLGRNSTTPYSSTITAIDNASVNLTASKMTVTVYVNSTTSCSTDATCEADYPSTGGAGSSTVTVTYPCDLNIFKIIWSSCTLTSTSTDIIQ